MAGDFKICYNQNIQPMNVVSILFKWRYFSMLFIMLFFTLVIIAHPSKAQLIEVNGGCNGGTPGLGGPQIPDLPTAGFPNGDGCINESDLSVFLSCWGSTLSLPNPGCLATQQALLNVNISPSPDSFIQGQDRSYTVTVSGVFGVPAGAVNFTVTQCPSGGTCTLTPVTCNMTADGSCFVTLNLANTINIPIGDHQVTVNGAHAGGLSSDGTSNLTVNPPPTIFVTSGTGPGDLDNNGIGNDWQVTFGTNIDCSGISNKIERGNCLCTGFAFNKPNIKPGEWHAWISSHTTGTPGTCSVNAKDNVLSAENQNTAMILPNGAKVLNTITDIFPGVNLLNAININEFNNAVGGQVWTGTTDSGACATSFVSRSCAYSSSGNISWNEGSTNAGGVYGETGTVGSGWTYNFNNPAAMQCNQAKRLYCIWYDSDIPPEWGGIIPAAPIGPEVINFNVSN